MDIFMEHKAVTVCMFASLALSIFLKVFLGMLYGHLIKETDNMATTDNKLLKQCKTKFSNCYELNNGISNIPVFVDKFINRLSLGFLSFEMLYHLSGQLMLLSVVFSGVGICRSILAGSTLGEILPFYIVSFMGLYLYFSVSTVVDIKRKKRILRINLVDYLENHLSPRIHVTRQDMERLYGSEAVAGRGRQGRAIDSEGNGIRQSSRDKDSENGIRRDSRNRDSENGVRQSSRSKDGVNGVRQGDRGNGGGEKRSGIGLQDKTPSGGRNRGGEGRFRRNKRDRDNREEEYREAVDSGKRTVELMPIGNRRQRPENPVADYREESEALPEGSPEEEREMAEAIADGRSLGEHGEKTDVTPESSSAVTEEELEALLKEFLIG
ncbi:MAG: hypothetical protein NC432_05555 [Roseburia sp.]|nr:hypothetical protein [Roseburia sp.]